MLSAWSSEIIPGCRSFVGRWYSMLRKPTSRNISMFLTDLGKSDSTRARKAAHSSSIASPTKFSALMCINERFINFVLTISTWKDSKRIWFDTCRSTIDLPQREVERCCRHYVAVEKFVHMYFGGMIAYKRDNDVTVHS